MAVRWWGEELEGWWWWWKGGGGCQKDFKNWKIIFVEKIMML